MNVTFLDTLASFDSVYVVGKTYDIEDKKAKKWIQSGLCKKADAPPKPKVADVKPVGETADAKPTGEVADNKPVGETASTKEV